MRNKPPIAYALLALVALAPLGCRRKPPGPAAAPTLDYARELPPGQVALRQRAEESLLGVPDSALREYFQKYRPVDSAGAPW